MSAKTERLAASMLRALKKEALREPSPVKSQRLNTVVSKLCKSQADYEKAVRFLCDNHFIDSWKRDDGVAAKPNEKGLAWLEERREKWTLDRRLALLAIIVSIAITAAGLLWQWLLQ